MGWDCARVFFSLTAPGYSDPRGGGWKGVLEHIFDSHTVSCSVNSRLINRFVTVGQKRKPQ